MRDHADVVERQLNLKPGELGWISEDWIQVTDCIWERSFATSSSSGTLEIYQARSGLPAGKFYVAIGEFIVHHGAETLEAAKKIAEDQARAAAAGPAPTFVPNEKSLAGS